MKSGHYRYNSIKCRVYSIKLTNLIPINLIIPLEMNKHLTRKIPDQVDLLIYSIQLQKKTENQFCTNSSYINYLDTKTKKENHRPNYINYFDTKTKKENQRT